MVSNLVLGNQLLRSGKLEEAVVAYQKAIAHHPNFHWSHYKLGEAFTKLGRFEQAIISYMRAVDLGLNKAHLFYDLGRTLAELKRWDEAVKAYRRAIELQPAQYKFYQHLGCSMLNWGEWEEGLKIGFKYGNIYDDIWQFLNQPTTDLYGNHNDWPINIDPAIVEQYFHKATQFNCISARKIYKLKGTQCLDNLGVQEFDKFFSNLTKLVDYHNNRNQNILEFKLNTIKNCYIECICPWSGKILKSTESFVLNYQTGGYVRPAFAYRFISDSTFYLFIGHGEGRKMCLYFPSVELIVVWFSKCWPETLCLKLKSYAVAKWLDFKNYLTNDSQELVGITGVLDHLTHTIVNEYSSYQELYESNLLNNFQKFIVGPYEYIPFEHLFDNLDKNNIIKKGDCNTFEMFDFCLKNNCFAIRPTNHALSLTEKLAQRIYDGAVNSCSETCFQKIQSAKKHFPLLWFEIKSNRRIWLNQEKGIAEIANRLYSDYPNLGIVLAGWSYTDQADPTDSKWVEQDKQVVEKVQALINNNIPVFPVVGYKVHEKIAWAGATHIHIITYGSGHIFGAIANKPLIIHANQSWYPAKKMKESFLQSTPLSSEFISVIPIENIKDDNPEVHYHARNYYCNWESIYHEIVKKLMPLDSHEKKTNTNGCRS